MRKLLLFVAVFLLGIPFALFSLIISKIQWDNYFYARDLFRSDNLEVTRVIGSKRWHGLFEGPFACSFAVAEISPASTAALVAEQSKTRSEASNVDQNLRYFWRFDHGPWPLTPISREKFNHWCSDIPRECCLNEFSKSDASLIMEALDAPGGWAFRDGEVTSFFLPKQNIVGTIRHSD